MQTLLAKRQLAPLLDLCDQLQTMLEECPRLFTASGNDGQTLLFTPNKALGTAEVLAKGHNTVRFKLNGSQHGHDTPSGRTGSPQQPFLGNGGRLEASVDALDMTNSAESATALERSRPSLSDAADETNAEVAHCCDAAWWLAERERRLVIAEEDAHRLTILNEFLEQRCTFAIVVCSTMTAMGRGNEVEAVAAVVADDSIAKVIGEKFGADGARYLLVQWWDASGQCPAVGEEEWVPLREVQHIRAVLEYLSRYERTYSSIADSPSDGILLGSNGSRPGALDTREREDLEHQLGLIRRRRLSSTSPIFPSLTASSSRGCLSPEKHYRGFSQDEFHDTSSPRSSSSRGPMSSREVTFLHEDGWADAVCLPINGEAFESVDDEELDDDINGGVTENETGSLDVSSHSDGGDSTRNFLQRQESQDPIPPALVAYKQQQQQEQQREQHDDHTAPSEPVFIAASQHTNWAHRSTDWQSCTSSEGTAHTLPPHQCTTHSDISHTAVLQHCELVSTAGNHDSGISSLKHYGEDVVEGSSREREESQDHSPNTMCTQSTRAPMPTFKHFLRDESAEDGGGRKASGNIDNLYEDVEQARLCMRQAGAGSVKPSNTPQLQQHHQRNAAALKSNGGNSKKHLTDSQRIEYEEFLHRTAMRILGQRRSVNSQATAYV